MWTYGRVGNATFALESEGGGWPMRGSICLHEQARPRTVRVLSLRSLRLAVERLGEVVARDPRSVA
jgi:hypothetical protein